MRRSVVGLAAALVAGAMAVGVWGVKDLPRFQAPPRLPPAASTPEGAPPAALAPVASRPASDLEAVPDGELRYRRLAVETDGDIPEACLVFSAGLRDDGALRYADYVDLPAGARVGFRVDGKRLCLAGFSFGSEYRLTLRAGLPGAGDTKLAEPVEVTVEFGDRPASVSFGPGFVLPRETSEGLPVTTVNVDRLDVKVYRIGDRLLARMRSDLVDERTFHAYRERELESDSGRLVWSGEMPVSGPRNDAVVSLFPLSEAIGKSEPGVYAVVARAAGGEDGEDGDYRPWSGQWVVQSDLGLTSFVGDDGLAIAVRSLHTARPAGGIRLALIARDNEILAERTTDADGMARFAPGLMRGTGGAAPVMVMAYGGGDFNFLDLRRPAFDLSDRGVDGRDPAGPVDAFLYTERGIYRPGENVELVSMLRDSTARAITGQSWTIRLTRPDGKEYRRFAVRDQGAGAGRLTVALPAAAARGAWEASAHLDPEGPAVGRVGFEVQDFVPQRLGLTVGAHPAALAPGEQVAIPVEARFLYGAPASALAGEAELAIEPDPAPFPAFKGFRWGMADERFAGDRVPLSIADTDESGRTMVTGALPAAIRSTLPLRADISIAIREPGGRATGEHVRIPIRTGPLALGIRPHFDGSVREGHEAAFDVIAVDGAGTRVGAEFRYRLLRDVSTWQWYRSGSRWRYERVAREREIAAGTLAVGASAPAIIRQAVGWGQYRLVVDDQATGGATSVRFWSGWYGDSSADRPDRLRIAADKPGYRPGETARLHVETDSAGEALLVVANERIHETRTLRIPAGGSDVTVAVGRDWGPGAYAMVTLYRPMTAELGHAPVRAVGVAWLGLDPAARTLGVEIAAPDRVEPRRSLAIPVTVTGGSGGVFLTLAAVDQGILQLTRFKTPSPQDHYLSKRRLGVAMRDDYGRLIRGLSGQGDGQGGDSFGGAGLDVVPTRTVALFSGLVRTDPSGRAVVPLDIPDFQGELRLMAVAFDTDRTGSAERRLTVRDPLVAELILPRFLAPGDSGRATVLVHNVDGAAGDYRVAVRARDTVSGGREAVTLPLPAGRREVFTVPLEGAAAGIGSVELAVAGPGGFAVARAWPIQVRPPQLPETRQTVRALAPGETETLGPELLDGLVPGTGAVTVSVSRWQGLDIPGLLRWLDRYPFGCLEQTTSRALPLLYFNDVALLAGQRADTGIADRVQDAVERVASMQDPDGGFRMWGGWPGEADAWLSVFALDFLDRADGKGFDVPRATMDRGRRWLAATASGHDRADVRTYAMAILARKGLANAGDLRYAHDHRAPETAIGLAHLASALDAVGERARAAEAYGRARNALAKLAALPRSSKAAAVLVAPYGSLLRDTYGVAALMASGGRAGETPAVLDSAGVLDTRAEGTTTQEKAWMLLAAAEMARNSGRLAVDLDGHPLGSGDPASLAMAPADLVRGATLHNAGDGEVFRVVSVEGIADAPLPASAEGVTLAKRVYTLDGRSADLGAIRRNDRLVVEVAGAATGQARGDYAILDLLPAGWEIEGMVRAGDAGFAWLGRLSDTRMREARDDRFAAALSLPDRQSYWTDDPKDWEFKVAYVVRAVTPGDFVLPAAVAEHMYLPLVKARTEMGRTAVAE